MGITKREKAFIVIDQFKKGLWEFHWNSLTGSYVTAKYNGQEIWCANGSFFTDFHPEESNEFGYFWRHFVYWLGIYPSRKKATLLKETK